ncbi:MAG: hypothetical protein FRX48_06740 [Lasallia pustulata]|uniref:Uncharacterized protein n=1 Tax=Lasallia pustulata TaxID=136370 RepID=A0A5M8PIN2_9LECA|nr:MAG: hypothetical protein FRX48_06740 [Lasallia pustulata]
MDFEDDPVFRRPSDDVDAHNDMDFEDILNLAQTSQSHRELTLPEINFNPTLPATNPDFAGSLPAASSNDQSQSQAQTNIDNTDTSASSLERQPLSGLRSSPRSSGGESSTQGPTPTQRSHESSSPRMSVDVEETAIQTDSSGCEGDPQHTIVANDNDDLVILEKFSSPPVKKERLDEGTGVSAHISKYAGMDTIEISSDSESDMEQRRGPQRHKGAERSLPASSVDLRTKAFLSDPKPKGKRTPAQIAKMFEAQKQIAMQVTGKKVTGGATSIFKGLQEAAGLSTGEPSSVSVSTTASASPPTTEEDEHAWMNCGTPDSDDGAAAAAAFARLKKKYMLKKKEGTNNWQDDVNFMKADTAENTRLKRIGKERMQADSSDDVALAFDDNEELFMRQEGSCSRIQKRHHTRTTANSNESGVRGDYTNVNGSGTSDDRYRSGDHPRKRSRGSDADEAFNQSLAVGIEAELARDKKKKRTEKKNEASQKKAATTNDKSKNGKVTGDKDKAKASKKSKPRAPRRSKKPDLLKNANSLVTSNVFVDTSHDRAALPPVTATTKPGALNALLASVPFEDQRTAQSDKQHILKATQVLGKHKCRADGKGAWKLKGMISSLMHHQVLGSAWMVERETAADGSNGGLVADEMGFGKTLQVLATMVANPPPPGEARKTTLVVGTPALVAQWSEEIDTHVEKNALGIVVRYHSNSRIWGTDAILLLQQASVILTTYGEVLRSYPKNNPPIDLLSYEKKKEWWEAHYKENRGLLHRLPFWRVVLDEAQAIKNRESQTSIACRGLTAVNRWALSGTPVQNNVMELFPYLKFLHVKHVGSFEVFKENFCDPNNEESSERLHAFLKRVMIRRVHSDLLFGAKILSLPKCSEQTIVVEFNETERAVYEIVRDRFIRRINSYQRANVLEKKYSSVLTMLLRLRQICAHLFLIQSTIEELFEFEDIERLYQGTMGETNSLDSQNRNMLVQMRKLIIEKNKPSESAQTSQDREASSVADADEEGPTSQGPPLIFKFRRYLRDLRSKSSWAELQARSLCHRCTDIPTDPYVTSCLHIYCKECLIVMSYDASVNGDDRTSCLACGSVYTESKACEGLKELEANDPTTQSPQPELTPRARRRGKDPEQTMKWVDFEGQVLPSAKTAALVAQVELWFTEEPKPKIVIFSQFQMMITIIARICQHRGWDYGTYHGKMTHGARETAIRDFKNIESKRILIMGLKAGGIGLNLTMASRVICIDLWWNKSVEQQAFCRIFRIGQVSETRITRFVVRNTVDEKLQEMQEDKQVAIQKAMDQGPGKLTLPDLMRLFGPVQEGADRKPFIIVDDDDEFDAEVPLNEGDDIPMVD